MLSPITLLLLSFASGVIELRIQVSEAATAQRLGDGSSQVSLLSSASRPGVMRRERRPELGPHQLVLVVVDRDGRQLDWRVVTDPRVVRFESADATGHLSGEVIRDTSAPFTLRIPDIPGATQVRIYQTEPADSGYSLSIVGTLELAK